MDVQRAQREIDLGPGSRNPEQALTLSQELTALRQQAREQEKEIRRLKELNEFLEEVSKEQRLKFVAKKRLTARSPERSHFIVLRCRRADRGFISI